MDYLSDISKGRGTEIPLKILFRWKGSVYKLLWIDLVLYLSTFVTLNTIYRLCLSDSDKKTFEKLVQYLHNMQKHIPVSFLLGFFVSGIISRWFTKYMSIPWLNRVAFLLDGYVTGYPVEKARKVRLTVMRYVNLAWILMMRNVSDQIGIRFRQPPASDVYDANLEDNQSRTSGFSDTDSNGDSNNLRAMFHNFNKDQVIKTTFNNIITESEIRVFEQIAAESYRKNSQLQYCPEYWIPLQWATRLIRKAFVLGYIYDPRTTNGLIEEIEDIRGQMQLISLLHAITIPLVYTQVVIIAILSYFFCLLFSTQYIRASVKFEGHEIDLYVPVFTTLKFLFLMGWFKVALCLMNPFGDDDEDFQTNSILDENLEATHMSAVALPCMYPEGLDQNPVHRFKGQLLKEEENLDNFFDLNDWGEEDEEFLDENQNIDIEEEEANFHGNEGMSDRAKIRGIQKSRNSKKKAHAKTLGLKSLEVSESKISYAYLGCFGWIMRRFRGKRNDCAAQIP